MCIDIYQDEQVLTTHTIHVHTGNYDTGQCAICRHDIHVEEIEISITLILLGSRL
jgi:hypothetical protein